VLRRLVIDQNETEAVVVELFEHLYPNGGKLRTCRARTEAGFRAWLRPVAANFALDCVERRGRAIAREKAAVSRAPLPDRAGPDEPQLQAWLDELRTRMTPRDFERLLKLAKLSTVETPIPDRTRRKWIVRLVNKCPDLFGDATPS
jgi:DNA-directed RNA polymerase specialized sigma24 family protein